MIRVKGPKAMCCILLNYKDGVTNFDVEMQVVSESFFFFFLNIQSRSVCRECMSLSDGERHGGKPEV